MDQKTELLISLGAATAANCVPCFNHYHEQAQKVGLSDEEITHASELAGKVKKGAHMVMRQSIKDIMKDNGESAPECSGNADACCCG